MELKVWVDGVQRVVCGLAERTTCQEVIYALAHATQRTGRFVLVEKWRKSERSLSPHDRPLELLSKWGEYASDVQFVLRCLEDTSISAPAPAVTPQRPASAMQQVIGQRSKLNGIGHHRRVNNSLDENGGPKSSDSCSAPGKMMDGNNQDRTTPLPNGGLLKPYFVDTSNPTPESGTLIRASTTTPQVQQPPPSYEAAPHSFIVRGTGTSSTSSLSPTSPPPPHQYFASGAILQRPTNSVMLANKPVQNGSLTVLSQSTHESFNSNSIVSSSFDSSGATLYLDGSYASNPQPTKQMDLSQTSFCSSSISSNTSLGAFSAGSSGQVGRMNGQRPPPPSYDTYVSKRRDQLMLANRSGQPSPLPLFGQQSQGRSRTPVVPSEQRPQGQMNREQLIRLIESQQFQIQAQCQTMRAYDTEIAQRESPDRQSQPTPIVEHLRRELQQLEVERVHVKQKVEELRRQNLDSQLATLRQTLAETLLESAKLDEKLKSMDAQMILNEEKIRSISVELERERGEILTLSSNSVNVGMSTSLNESILASNEAFEARIRTLDEMLATRRKQLESGQVGDSTSGSAIKVRSRSFDSSVQAKTPTTVVELTSQQRPIENANGVWV